MSLEAREVAGELPYVLGQRVGMMPGLLWSSLLELTLFHWLLKLLIALTTFWMSG